VAKNAMGAVIAAFSVNKFLTTGAEFQDALADLSAITGATGKDLDTLQKTIFTLGKQSATSASEVADGFKLVASAKPELLENLDALAATTEQVLLLKNAAGIELASAAQITAQGLNIFGAGADQAARFVNVLAAGAKLGSSEIADTGEAMLIAGPAARAAGLSFEQLNAAIQTVAKGGIKAQRSGTALNAIFGRLQRLGIDFQKLGLQGAFELVDDKMQSLSSSTDRAKLAAKIFGEEHVKVGFALLQNSRFLGKYEKSLAGTNIAQEQADIRLKTFNAKFRKLGVTVDSIIIKTFLRLEPVISKQVERLGELFDTIKPERLEAFAQSLVQVAKLLSVVGEAVKLIAKGFNIVGTEIGEFTAKTTLFAENQIKRLESALEFFGVTPKETKISGGKVATQADINVTLRAPEKTVESVKSKTSGKNSGLNVGMNLVTAP
jgi:TP901 family phage tail tape measure protein